MKEIEIGGMSPDTGKKTTVKLLVNRVKAQMAIDSSASANITDEGRLQKIQEESKEMLRREIQGFMGMPVKLRYPLPENSMRWLKVTR